MKGSFKSVALLPIFFTLCLSTTADAQQVGEDEPVGTGVPYDVHHKQEATDTAPNDDDFSAVDACRRAANTAVEECKERENEPHGEGIIIFNCFIVSAWLDHEGNETPAWECNTVRNSDGDMETTFEGTCICEGLLMD